MILGSFIDKEEDECTEYKEFCLKINVYSFYSLNEVTSIIRRNIFPSSFNEFILHNLRKYIEIYVPKYGCAFHNISKSGILRIGINDYKEITGIPFIGYLKQFNSDLQSYINEQIKKNVDNKCCLNIISEIHECDKDNDILDDINLKKILKKHDNEKIKYENAYKKYTNDKKKWISQIMKYKAKLQYMLDDPKQKKEFINFLKNENLYHKFPEIHTNYIIDVDKIKDYKKDNTHMIYWLIKYKDDEVDKLCKNKPQAPKIPRSLNMEFCLITQMSELRKRWCQNGMRYYVIDIHFNNFCEKKLKCFSKRKQKWRYLIRNQSCISEL